MDMHAELSYCTFQGFKTLANNYLGIKEHVLFDEIKELMEKNNIMPANVAENLMPKTPDGIANHHIEACLRNLVQAPKNCKPKIEDNAEEEENGTGGNKSHQNGKEEECSTKESN